MARPTRHLSPPVSDPFEIIIEEPPEIIGILIVFGAFMRIVHAQPLMISLTHMGIFTDNPNSEAASTMPSAKRPYRGLHVPSVR